MICLSGLFWPSLSSQRYIFSDVAQFGILLSPVFDHSTLFAPINFLMYAFSRVPNQPYIDTQHFKDLKVLDENWEMIRDEAQALYQKGGIKASSKYDDLGFNSFLRRAGNASI